MVSLKMISAVADGLHTILLLLLSFTTCISAIIATTTICNFPNNTNTEFCSNFLSFTLIHLFATLETYSIFWRLRKKIDYIDQKIIKNSCYDNYKLYYYLNKLRNKFILGLTLKDLCKKYSVYSSQTIQSFIEYKLFLDSSLYNFYMENSFSSIDGELQHLPTIIGLLQNLNYLMLHNKLQSLPTEIGLLINLQVINLYYNELELLPTEIGKLINLQVMTIHNNKLQSLPTEIGKIKNLQSIWAHNNELQLLPTEIGLLQNLDHMCFYNNNLQIIPTEIGLLCNLWCINLRGNKLQTIPTEIGQLLKLRELILSCNKLEIIPSEIKKLKVKIFFE